MRGEQAIVGILQGNATYGAHVGGTGSNSRVYFDEATQAKVFPLCVVSLQGVSPNDTKDDWGEYDEDMVQVLHHALDKKKANDMAADARTVLNYYAAGTYNGVQVVSIHMVDQDSYTERLIDKKIFVTEQIYKVTTKK